MKEIGLFRHQKDFQIASVSFSGAESSYPVIPKGSFLFIDLENPFPSPVRLQFLLQREFGHSALRHPGPLHRQHPRGERGQQLHRPAGPQAGGGESEEPPAVPAEGDLGSQELVSPVRQRGAWQKIELLSYEAFGITFCLRIWYESRLL